jgi:hypothetical protein
MEEKFMKKNKTKKLKSKIVLVATAFLFALASVVIESPIITFGNSSPVFTLNITHSSASTSYDYENNKAITNISIGAEVLKDGRNTGTLIDKWEVTVRRTDSTGNNINTEFTTTEVLTDGVSNLLSYTRNIDTLQSKIEELGNPSSLYFKFSVKVYLAQYKLPPGETFIATGNGDTTSGFYGFVPASDFITGNDLAAQIGLTAGTSQDSDAGWLKFSGNGKTLYVAMKTFRHSISWDHINAVSAVYGNRTVVINGNLYKIRLLTGGDADPASSAGGEWNSLIYGVHMSTNPQWGPGYSDSDLNVGTGNGRGSWTQELGSTSSYRVVRGVNGVSDFNRNTYSRGGTSSNLGWRPVLELVD